MWVSLSNEVNEPITEHCWWESEMFLSPQGKGRHFSERWSHKRNGKKRTEEEKGSNRKMNWRIPWQMMTVLQPQLKPLTQIQNHFSKRYSIANKRRLCGGSRVRGAWHLGMGSLFPLLSYPAIASSGTRLIIKIPFPCFHYCVSSFTKEQCQHAWIMSSQDWKCFSGCGWNELSVVSRAVVVVSVCAPSLFYLLKKTHTYLINTGVLL